MKSNQISRSYPFPNVWQGFKNINAIYVYETRTFANLNLIRLGFSKVVFSSGKEVNLTTSPFIFQEEPI